jgi:hypothetical protein
VNNKVTSVVCRSAPKSDESALLEGYECSGERWLADEQPEVEEDKSVSGQLFLWRRGGGSGDFQEEYAFTADMEWAGHEPPLKLANQQPEHVPPGTTASVSASGSPLHFAASRPQAACARRGITCSIRNGPCCTWDPADSSAAGAGYKRHARTQNSVASVTDGL